MTCPQCGAPQIRRQKEGPLAKFLIFTVIVLAAVFGFVVLSPMLTPETVTPEQAAQRAADKESRKAETQEEILLIELKHHATKAVRDRLKAPSTAKFPDTVWKAHEYNIYKMNDFHRVFSWVDSQNGFGAMIRSQWAVDLKKVGDDWEILKVTIE
jgi:hypothetical protein